MGVEENRRKERKIKEMGIGLLTWSKPNPISIRLFNMLAQEPVGPNIRQLKAQAQIAVHTRISEASPKIRRVRSDPSPKLNEISKLFLFNFNLFN
jgi:hypothetical protein